MEFIRRVVQKTVFTMCRSPFKEACAEFLGTFFLVLCGDGVMACITLGRIGHGAPIASALGWGLALLIGISIAGGISGGHLNPAVTVALAVMKKCSKKNAVVYLLAQYLAGFVAAAVVYLVYYDAIASFDNGFRQLPPNANSTAQIFSTYPQEFASTASCFADQVVSTALLLVVISAAVDQRNMNLTPFVQATVIGLGFTVIILAFGYNCGAPLNPARDLSPRIFTAIAGWGVETFSFRNYMWFWIPVLGPHVGGVIGVLLYDFCIGMPFRNSERLMEEMENSGRDEEERLQSCATVTKSTLRPVADRSLSSDDSTRRAAMDRSSTPEEEQSNEKLDKSETERPKV